MPQPPKPPQRLHGTGQIRWLEARQAYLAEHSLTGKRLSKSFPAAHYPTPRKALEAAETWLAEQAQAKRKGELRAGTEMTLEEFGRRYTDRKRSEWKPKHHHSFSSFLERFAYPVLGGVRLSELTPMMLEDWTDHIRKTPMNSARASKHGKVREPKVTTPYMAYKALFYLRLLLNQAEEKELIPRNPARKVKLPKPKRDRNKLTRWSPDEVRKVLGWLREHDHWLLPYVHIALTTGMRREELFGLTWARVNLERRYLDVQEVVTYVNGRWSFDSRPKNDNAARRIYFDEGTARMFELQRAKNAEMKATFEKKGSRQWNEMGLVFPSTKGTPMAEGRFYKGFDELCVGAGVRRIRPYDSRSTWTTLSKGKMPEYVAVARAGHSQSVRDEHYARDLEEEQQAAALSLEELTGFQPVRKSGSKRVQTGPSEATPAKSKTPSRA